MRVRINILGEVYFLAASWMPQNVKVNCRKTSKRPVVKATCSLTIMVGGSSTPRSMMDPEGVGGRSREDQGFSDWPKTLAMTNNDQQ